MQDGFSHYRTYEAKIDGCGATDLRELQELAGL